MAAAQPPVPELNIMTVLNNYLTTTANYLASILGISPTAVYYAVACLTLLVCLRLQSIVMARINAIDAVEGKKEEETQAERAVRDPRFKELMDELTRKEKEDEERERREREEREEVEKEGKGGKMHVQ